MNALEPTTPPSTKVLPDHERDASLSSMLDDWGGDAVWVFGYGSLIWRPDFAFDRKQRGLVHGYHRSLCLWSEVYRGTPERPGLVLGLKPGGSVHGVAFRIPAPLVREQLRILWARELVTGDYVPRWLDVRLDDGARARAIGFVMDRSAVSYAAGLEPAALLDTVCTASGRNGSCADYVLFTVRSLDEHGIHDRRLARLAADVAARMAS